MKRGEGWRMREGACERERGGRGEPRGKACSTRHERMNVQAGEAQRLCSPSPTPGFMEALNGVRTQTRGAVRGHTLWLKYLPFS